VTAMNRESDPPNPPSSGHPGGKAYAPDQGPQASLRRELVAIAVLYVVLSVLPLLIGLAFAP